MPSSESESEEVDTVKLEAQLRKLEAVLSITDKKITTLVKKRDELHKERLTIKQKIQREATLKLQNKDWTNKDHPWFAKLDHYLKDVFKIQALRSYQLPTINAVMQNTCTILIMPTGGGKSLCYQLPALLLPGVTIVISPLVSLMEDQVLALKALKIKADLLHAGKPHKEITEIERKIVEGGIKLVYCTPERLSKSKRFMSKLEKAYLAGNLSLIAVDEVHCCSQWGHDFRPDYKFLGILRKQFPKVPILGLTATAPVNVLQDVQQLLKMEGCLVFKANLNRPNLFYEVRQKSSNHQELMTEMAELINEKYHGQSGIVYCFSIKDSIEVARDLRDHGVKAKAYHAQLQPDERRKIHLQWAKCEVHVIVATIAFGMGIDKPNVRFVIHHSISKSMESYYQESGRAGRDEVLSKCIIFYRLGDMFRQSVMVFSERTGLEKLYGMVAYCIDQTRCRREIMSQHFGEDWDMELCQKMCDSCLSCGMTKSTDVTKLCKLIYNILDKAGVQDERMTAVKLLDTVQGKTHTKLRPTNFEIVPFNRDTLECILALLLVEGYLEEDFHFTPYTTISYLKMGTKSGLVREENVEVIFNLPSLKRNIDLQLKPSVKKISKMVADVVKKKPVKTKPATYAKSDSLAKKIKLEKQVVELDSDSDGCEVVSPQLDVSFGKF